MFILRIKNKIQIKNVVKKFLQKIFNSPRIIVMNKKVIGIKEKFLISSYNIE